MRVSFYIKLFFAFIVFAILLLGFSSFAFNNFYEFHNKISFISDYYHKI